jgi:hypothetical protein
MMTTVAADDFLSRYDQKKEPFVKDVGYTTRSTRIKMGSVIRLGRFKAPETREPHRKKKPQIKRPSWMRRSKDKKKEKSGDKVAKKDKRCRFKRPTAMMELGEEEVLDFFNRF